jgi:hypothetical protein
MEIIKILKEEGYTITKTSDILEETGNKEEFLKTFNNSDDDIKVSLYKEEIESLESDLTKFSEYKDNPSKYLLEKYQELSDVLSAQYKTERHTIITTDVNTVGSLTKGKISSTGFSVVGKGYKSNISWSNKIYIIDNTGTSYIKYITDRVPVDYSSEDLGVSKIVGASSDLHKYTIVIEDDSSIYVKLTEELKDSVQFMNVSGKLSSVYSTSSEKIKIKGSDKSTHTIKLSNYLKSRRSASTRLMKGKAVISDVEFM